MSDRCEDESFESEVSKEIVKKAILYGTAAVLAGPAGVALAAKLDLL